jgi:hypothetical protein
MTLVSEDATMQHSETVIHVCNAAAAAAAYETIAIVPVTSAFQLGCPKAATRSRPVTRRLIWMKSYTSYDAAEVM